MKEDFMKCVNCKQKKDGLLKISCKKGLWSVEGREEKQVANEAYYYFTQYRSDGEYNDILKPTDERTEG